MNIDKAGFLGAYHELYEAQTNIAALRSGRNSGDIVTTICIFLLEKGIIDSVLAVKMDNARPYKAVPIIARTREEVLQCAGSKYTYVDYGKISELNMKSVLVGLPCQIHRKSATYLKVGLFCGLNTSDAKLDYILKWQGIQKEEIVHLDWRSPKNRQLEVRMKSGKVYYFELNGLNYFFPRPQCLRCTDYSNHFADISVGDRIAGSSAVIVRTKLGDEVFTSAIVEGYIKAKKISIESFLEKRMSPLFQKELRGGYIKVPLVRCYGKWITFIPPPLLRFAGRGITTYVKRFSAKDSEAIKSYIIKVNS